MAMASSGTATVTLPADEQILITREFDAPKHLVYRAWTERFEALDEVLDELKREEERDDGADA